MKRNVTYGTCTDSGYGNSYDAKNRMESFSINGVVQAEYRYNALGQQVLRRLTQAGQTLHVVHNLDGNRIADYEYDPVLGASTRLCCKLLVIEARTASG